MVGSNYLIPKFPSAHSCAQHAQGIEAGSPSIATGFDPWRYWAMSIKPGPNPSSDDGWGAPKIKFMDYTHFLYLVNA
jgi:hypothetical protein